MKFEREARLRLFPQLHQSSEAAGYRASGAMRCGYCGLTYRQHPVEEAFNIDHRLCNGDIVHL